MLLEINKFISDNNAYLVMGKSCCSRATGLQMMRRRCTDALNEILGKEKPRLVLPAPAC